MVAAGNPVAAEPTGPERGVDGNAHMTLTLSVRHPRRIARVTEIGSAERTIPTSYFRWVLLRSGRRQLTPLPDIRRLSEVDTTATRQRPAAEVVAVAAGGLIALFFLDLLLGLELFHVVLPALAGDIAVIGALALSLVSPPRTIAPAAVAGCAASIVISLIVHTVGLGAASNRDWCWCLARFRRARRIGPAHGVERPLDVTHWRADLCRRLRFGDGVDRRVAQQGPALRSAVGVVRRNLGFRGRRRLVPACPRRPPGRAVQTGPSPTNAWPSPASCTTSSPTTSPASSCRRRRPNWSPTEQPDAAGALDAIERAGGEALGRDAPDGRAAARRVDGRRARADRLDRRPAGDGRAPCRSAASCRCGWRSTIARRSSPTP